MQTLIIAEAGVNHNGSIDLAKQLIDAARDAKADFVKFQTFRADRIVNKTADKAKYQISNSNKSETQYELLKKLELTERNFRELKRYCDTQNVKFLSTAFDLESIDFLKTLSISVWKIPSGEITNLPYLERIGSFNEKVILSTGMSELSEIEDALNVLVSSGTDKNNISILHCNTEYPTPMEDVNLNAILSLKEKFGMRTGYSDHTLGIEIPVAAVAIGATIIEKHFTLDKRMNGPDHKASISPIELKEMVKSIRNVETAMGTREKTVSPSEYKNRIVARKSIHVKYDLPKGHVLTKEDLTIKRPGNGISPMEYYNTIGKRLLADMKGDKILKWEDLE